MLFVGNVQLIALSVLCEMFCPRCDAVPNSTLLLHYFCVVFYLFLFASLVVYNACMCAGLALPLTTTGIPLYSPIKLGTLTMPFSCHSMALHMRSISSSDPSTLMEFSVSSSLLSSLIWNSSTRSPDLQ